MREVRVILASPRAMWRDLVSHWMAESKRFSLVCVAATADEAARAARTEVADLLLLDLYFPTARDGLRILSLASGRTPPLTTLVISEEARPFEVSNAIAAGAMGMLCKMHDGTGELSWAIDRLASGNFGYTSAIAMALAEHVRMMTEMQGALSAREVALLSRLAAGETLKAACAALGIGSGASSSYIDRARRKLGLPAGTRSAAVARVAASRGLLAHP